MHSLESRVVVGPSSMFLQVCFYALFSPDSLRAGAVKVLNSGHILQMSLYAHRDHQTIKDEAQDGKLHLHTGPELWESGHRSGSTSNTGHRCASSRCPGAV